VAEVPTVDELAQVSYKNPKTSWMDSPVDIRSGIYCYGAQAKNLEVVSFPNARDFDPTADDWKLPPNWQDIIQEGISER